jgi:hypothetical protein
MFEIKSKKGTVILTAPGYDSRSVFEDSWTELSDTDYTAFRWVIDRLINCLEVRDTEDVD